MCQTLLPSELKKKKSLENEEKINPMLCRTIRTFALYFNATNGLSYCRMTAFNFILMAISHRKKKAIPPEKYHLSCNKIRVAGNVGNCAKVSS